MSATEDRDESLRIARQVAEIMWDRDRASQGLGCKIVDIGPGTAVIEMTVREDMVNGHGTAHGGFIFALADSAFAFACNSHGDAAVAANCSIGYLAPGKLGDRLVATAREVVRSGRSGIYDVRVTCSSKIIAEFRGHSRVIGSHFPLAETKLSQVD
jgi:acyl-CoA thioesterase